ncbi:MAG: twin-arginine translocation signal domain-containing protein, partial [Verrucomicrobia bacterium]|nr:twin-arginine translocation signal domain-containing protein [Verrucomicrobiota bacterium]
MNRRDFLITSATATTALALGARAASPALPGSANDLLRDIIRANDAQIPALLARQERTPGHRWIGGLTNSHGLATVADTNGFVAALACAACAPGSRYYNDAALAAPMLAAIAYMLSAQHADGTVDYYATNFHSTPDLAFILEGSCPAYQLLRGNTSPAFAPVAAELAKFIKRGGEALIVGGVHTPNHRWVVCAALAWVNSLFPDARYVARADQWLAETIDLDPDGQYTEKSTTVYSPIVNQALINVARLLNRPALLEPVRRNLEMTRYYLSYRTLALHDGNGRFAAMARQIERNARSQ